MIKDFLNKIDKRQKILAGVLILIIIVAFVTSPKSQKNDDVVSQVSSIIKTSNEPVSGKQVVDELRYFLDENETELAYVGTWKNDPFYYVKKGQGKKEGSGLINQLIGSGEKADGEPNTPKFSLTGISFQGNSGTALVNGEPLQRGQTIQGYTVTKIAEDYVLLKRGNNSIRLTINER